MKNFYDFFRMVFCGVGMEYDIFVEMVRDIFVKKILIWKENFFLVDLSKFIDNFVF